MEYAINEYARLMGSLSVSQSDKEKIEEQLFKSSTTKKEFPKKQVAAASVAVLLTVGIAVAIRNIKNGAKNSAR